MCGVVTIYSYHKKLASVSPRAHDDLGSWPFQDGVLRKKKAEFIDTLPSIHE